MRKLRPRDVRREVGGLGPYQSQQEVSATWPEAAGPHACSSSVGGPARSSGFESHLHPSLARTLSSLGLSSRTSQTARPFSRSQGVGRGEIEHRLQSPGDGPRWDLRGHFVVCSVPSYCVVGTWEGRTRCPSALSPPHTGPPATASTGSLLPDSLALPGRLPHPLSTRVYGARALCQTLYRALQVARVHHHWWETDPGKRFYT